MDVVSRASYRPKVQRVKSAELADLHVYIVPPELWRERYNNLLNQNVTETISAGIIRVHPDTRVCNLRDELDSQLGSELLPRDYIFLKSVGRSITRLKPKQEFQLKAKHFLPPNSYAPELYLLEVENREDENDTVGSTRPTTRSPQFTESEDERQSNRHRQKPRNATSPYRYSSPLPKIKSDRGGEQKTHSVPHFDQNGDLDGDTKSTMNNSWGGVPDKRPSPRHSPVMGRRSPPPRSPPRQNDYPPPQNDYQHEYPPQDRTHLNESPTNSGEKPGMVNSHQPVVASKYDPRSATYTNQTNDSGIAGLTPEDYEDAERRKNEYNESRHKDLQNRLNGDDDGTDQQRRREDREREEWERKRREDDERRRREEEERRRREEEERQREENERRRREEEREKMAREKLSGSDEGVRSKPFSAMDPDWSQRGQYKDSDDRDMRRSRERSRDSYRNDREKTTSKQSKRQPSNERRQYDDENYARTNFDPARQDGERTDRQYTERIRGDDDDRKDRQYTERIRGDDDDRKYRQYKERIRGDDVRTDQQYTERNRGDDVRTDQQYTDRNTYQSDDRTASKRQSRSREPKTGHGRPQYQDEKTGHGRPQYQDENPNYVTDAPVDKRSRERTQGQHDNPYVRHSNNVTNPPTHRQNNYRDHHHEADEFSDPNSTHYTTGKVSKTFVKEDTQKHKYDNDEKYEVSRNVLPRKADRSRERNFPTRESEDSYLPNSPSPDHEKQIVYSSPEKSTDRRTIDNTKNIKARTSHQSSFPSQQRLPQEVRQISNGKPVLHKRKPQGKNHNNVKQSDLNRFPSPPPMNVSSSVQDQDTRNLTKEQKQAEIEEPEPIEKPDKETSNVKKETVKERSVITKLPSFKKKNDKKKNKSEEEKRLMQELEAAREARRAVERQREELVKKAKLMQNKTQNRRNHARDLWKKRYFEEKKRTPPLEEQCNKLRHELDVIHRKLMNALEGSSKDKNTRTENLKPSRQNNYKIQATRLTHEIDDLRRRLENAKMKLTAEMKLRNQAETELRALRAELTQKKIHLTLARQQQIAMTPSGTGTGDNTSRYYRTPALSHKA